VTEVLLLERISRPGQLCRLRAPTSWASDFFWFTQGFARQQRSLHPGLYSGRPRCGLRISSASCQRSPQSEAGEMRVPASFRHNSPVRRSANSQSPVASVAGGILQPTAQAVGRIAGDSIAGDSSPRTRATQMLRVCRPHSRAFSLLSVYPQLALWATICRRLRRMGVRFTDARSVVLPEESSRAAKIQRDHSTGWSASDNGANP
jgi:hypothetical protein